MIKILGFKKTFFKKTILQFNKLEFEKTGFYLIYGRSGCGKTTLLNCLSLLENFDGDYKIDGQKVNDLSDEEKANTRKEFISYVHQKPVLLNDFSVFDNVKLFSNLKDADVLNYLAQFNLLNKIDQPIKLLSGGEKQRISLIKSLILQKPIVLADEPTGALDKENAIFIIEKLKEISKKHLVIVVSHDVQLFKQYADSIIAVKNKTISIEKEKMKNYESNKTLYRCSSFENKLIEKKYSKHIVKKRKIKNFLVSMFTSLSLICVSLTMLISFNVKQELINGFSEFYEPNQVVIQNRSSNSTNLKRNSPNEDELKQIEELLNTESRPCYTNNFETFFKDGNSLHLVLKYKTKQIEGFSARNFNEFKYLDGKDQTYLSKDKLEKDEVVISIDNQIMLDVCFQLSITKTFSSLFSFLKANEVYLSLFIKNFDWEYEDEQLFRWVGFVIEPEKFVYHTDKSFSQFLFEESMKLPSTIYDEVLEKPWYLKKEYIIDIDYEDSDLFFDDDYLSNFYIEKLSNNHFQTWYGKNNLLNDGLFKIYKKTSGDSIPINKIKRLKENDFPYYLTNNFYIKNSLISGFANEIFLSSSIDTISFIEDNYFKSEVAGKIQVDESLDALCGGMLVDSKNLFKLEYKEECNNKNGVTISRKLYEKLSKSLQNSTIFVIGLRNRYSNNNKIIKEYVKNEIKIGEIVENTQDCVLYGNKYFYCTFLRDYLGYNYEKYAGSAVNLTINDEKTEQIIRQYFYNYNVSKPFEEINTQIDSILNVLQIILSIFSIIIILISVFLLSLIIKSFILDFREDLYVLYCNGLSKKSISKILKRYIRETFIKGGIITIIFNLGISLMIGFIVSNLLSTSFNFSFSWQSLIASALLSLIMTFIGHLFINKFIEKENIVISIRN